MEEVIDFDQWYLNHKIVIEYWAVYDPETGKVKGIYPNESADAYEHKIKVDSEIAEAIGAGKILLSNCFIDFDSDTLEITEVKSLLKIDDVLHRVIEKQWTDTEDPEVTIKFNNNILRFNLSEKAKGKKRVHYNGDTLMDFYITGYNDPNILLEKITIQLDDLVKKDQDFQLDVDGRFSVFTRRIFKKYVLINENN
jgi:hypothetical protein